LRKERRIERGKEGSQAVQNQVLVEPEGSLGFRMGGPHMGVLRLGESAIALKVKVNALE